MATKKKSKTKAKPIRKRKIVSRSKPIKEPSPKTARRKIDPRTGVEISRRQYEKLYGRKRKAPNAAAAFRHKFQLYKQVRDDFIEKQKKDGKKLTKREAMNSAELKKIIRDLHSKNPITKAAALARTGRITPDQIELYTQKFANED